MSTALCLSPSTPQKTADRGRTSPAPLTPVSPEEQEERIRMPMMTLKLPKNAVRKTRKWKNGEVGSHRTRKVQPWVRRFMEASHDEEDKIKRHKALLRALYPPKSIIRRVKAYHAKTERWEETDLGEEKEEEESNIGINDSSNVVEKLPEIELDPSLSHNEDNITIVKRFQNFFNPYATAVVADAKKADYDTNITEYDREYDLNMFRLPTSEREVSLLESIKSPQPFPFDSFRNRARGGQQGRGRGRGSSTRCTRGARGSRGDRVSKSRKNNPRRRRRYPRDDDEYRPGKSDAEASESDDSKPASKKKARRGGGRRSSSTSKGGRRGGGGGTGRGNRNNCGGAGAGTT